MKIAHVEVGQVWMSRRGKELVSAFRIDKVGSLYVTGSNLDKPRRTRQILRSQFVESPGAPYKLVDSQVPKEES